MISRIEALNFRSLKYVNQTLSPFQILVGPNASGKTTFLDVVSFLGDLVSNGLEFAIKDRTENFQDLVWMRLGEKFELAIEVRIPDSILPNLNGSGFDVLRYEVSIGATEGTEEISILGERAILKKEELPSIRQQSLFPIEPISPTTILSPIGAKGSKIVFNKSASGSVNYYSEVSGKSGKGWAPNFKLGVKKSALANLPEDETRYPTATWLKSLLSEGVQQFVLNSLLIRKASPPGQTRNFKPDGSNLPWVIHNLSENHKEKFQDWISHIQTALPDIRNITTTRRPEDSHRYLTVHYRGGLSVPSWMVSDGTLRLLALTIPAYLPDFQGIYLIEEPENGIHPKAVETVFQSLSSVYDAQILLATHSTIILGIAEQDSLLCFAKTESGATNVIKGTEHPRLRKWKGETNLGILFASGVLG
jgi:predicted ATPase